MLKLLHKLFKPKAFWVRSVYVSDCNKDGSYREVKRPFVKSILPKFSKGYPSDKIFTLEKQQELFATIKTFSDHTITFPMSGR